MPEPELKPVPGLQAGADDGQHPDALFVQARTDPSARDELVSLYYPLAKHLAAKFKGRGQPLDDLIQVASIGLLNAIQRFDPDRGIKFTTFATPTIVGELKRYFRDKGWALRVPRRLQEMSLTLREVVEGLSQELGRSPTVTEIADRSGLSQEEVVEGIESIHAYSVGSLDAAVDDQGSTSLARLGAEDEAIELLETWANLAPHLKRLAERDRTILYYRFIRGFTQSKIADLMGMSQMHISRLLAQTLQTLREAIDVEAG
jgi:RNA polymerase sigma-B factor